MLPVRSDLMFRSILYDEQVFNLLQEKAKKVKYNDEDHQHSVDEVIKNWEKDIKNDYDINIIITGYEGSGKTTFAVLLAEKLKELYDYNYTFITSSKNFLENIKNPDMRVIILDEAIAHLYARESMSTENKMFVKLLTMCRSKNKILLFLIPRIRNIDIYMRADRVYQWFEIRERNTLNNTGLAHWYIRDLNNYAKTQTFDFELISFAIQEANRQAFRVKEAEKLIRKNLYAFCPNYAGHIVFKVDERIKSIAKKFSDQLKNENFDRAEKDLEQKEIHLIYTKIAKKVQYIRTLKSFYKEAFNKVFDPTSVILDSDLHNLTKFLKSLNTNATIHNVTIAKKLKTNQISQYLTK